VAQHDLGHVVAEGFLQVHVALRDALGNAAADEIVVDHFVEFVLRRRAQRQRHVDVDVDQHALLAAFLEIVHADVDPDLVVEQEEAPAIHQRGVGELADHEDTF